MFHVLNELGEAFVIYSENQRNLWNILARMLKFKYQVNNISKNLYIFLIFKKRWCTWFINHIYKTLFKYRGNQQFWFEKSVFWSQIGSKRPQKSGKIYFFGNQKYLKGLIHQTYIDVQSCNTNCVPDQFIFVNISLRWLITTSLWNPIGLLILWPNH